MLLINRQRWSKLYYEKYLVALIHTNPGNMSGESDDLSSNLLLCKNAQLKLNQRIPFHEHNATDLSELYRTLKQSIYEKQLKPDKCKYHLSLGEVFANNELNLRNIPHFGFNYDYTLAIYSEELHGTLYKMAAKALVEEYGYPLGIKQYDYDGSFPIRGLHFDMKNGYLMKVSAVNRIQLGSVYKGYQKITDEEVTREYGGNLLNVDLLSMGRKKYGARIFQQLDLFSMSFLSLLTNTIDFFMRRNIEFDPWYIYNDVRKAIDEAQSSGKLHRAISEDLHRFLPKKKALETYLNRLLSNNKKLFLLTNSPFTFVDKGMTHLINSDWRDIFEVVIVNSRKPSFFTDKSRPFRNIDIESGNNLWDHVKEFQRYGVYAEGNIKTFTELTGFQGSNVIYFADHVHTDLIDPVERVGWRTGAVIPELESEIKISHSDSYIRDIEWLVTLEHLITALQLNAGVDSNNRSLEEWKYERMELRRKLKHLFNPYFGSMFRTHLKPTSFSDRITRYADVYVSSIENLLNYSDDFHFLPCRNMMPHERI